MYYSFYLPGSHYKLVYHFYKKKMRISVLQLLSRLSTVKLSQLWLPN